MRRDQQVHGVDPDRPQRRPVPVAQQGAARAWSRRKLSSRASECTKASLPGKESYVAASRARRRRGAASPGSSSRRSPSRSAGPAGPRSSGVSCMPAGSGFIASRAPRSGCRGRRRARRAPRAAAAAGRRRTRSRAPPTGRPRGSTAAAAPARPAGSSASLRTSSRVGLGERCLRLLARRLHEQPGAVLAGAAGRRSPGVKPEPCDSALATGGAEPLLDQRRGPRAAGAATRGGARCSRAARSRRRPGPAARSRWRFPPLSVRPRARYPVPRASDSGMTRVHGRMADRTTTPHPRRPLTDNHAADPRKQPVSQQQRAPAGQDRPRDHPQLLHHRPHRPRQVDAGRPDAAAHRRRRRAQRPGAVPRPDGHRARARHHHQEPGRADAVDRPGGQRGRCRAGHLHPQHDRHPGARRLHLRGVPLARGVRGRGPARRRRPGHRGADAGEPLPRARRGPARSSRC